MTTIFATFESIFMYNIKKGFQIVTVTANNELSLLAELMLELI